MKSKSQNTLPLATIVKKHLVKSIFIPLLLFAVIINTVLLTLLVEEAIKDNQFLAQIGCVALDKYFDTAFRIAKNFASEYENVPGKSVTIFRKILEIDPVFNNFFIVQDNKAIEIFPTLNYGAIRYAANKIAEDLINSSSKIKQIITPPFYSAYSNEVSVALAYFVSKDSYAIGELNLTKFLIDKIFLSKLEGTTTMFIVDRYGNFVIHPNPKLVAERRNIGDENWFIKARHNKHFSGIVHSHGHWQIVSTILNPNSSWFFVVTTNLIAALTPFAYWILIMTGIFLVFCVWTFYTIRKEMSSSVISPIEQLQTLLQRIEELPEVPSEVYTQLATQQGPIEEIESFRKTFLNTFGWILNQEDSLKESSLRFQTLLHNIPVAVLIFQDNHFIYANKVAEQISGFKQEALVKTPCWELIHPDHREELMHMIQMRQQELRPAMQYPELPIITKSGQIKWLQTTVGSIVVNGRPAGIVMATDITEQRKAEQEKKEMEKKFQYLQRMEALGILAAGVAHEFNNILHGIGLNIEMLRFTGICPTEADKYLNTMEHLKKRASMLVEALLTFTRKKQSSKRLIHAHSEIQRVITIYSETLPKTIEVKTNLKATSDTIEAEEGQIEHIIMNLITNARDAIGNEFGTISVETETVIIDEPEKLKLPQKGKYMKIKVSDTGEGIPEEIMSKIFDPFFTTKEIGKGTGLGLSMVLGIVKSLGGSIFCDSAVQSGTTVNVLLPLVEITKQSTTSQKSELEKTMITQDALPTPPRSLEKPRILIIEDEEILASLIQECLQKEGYEASTFNTPEKAIEHLGSIKRTPDVVIMDLGLPGIGGEACLEHIRKMYPTLPVIVISGYLDHKILKHPEKYGVKACLSKPFSTQQFLQTLNEILAK
ncbi:MAG: response regulator [Deltaproteobacteria bacterium]|nr:response regulator [Deltaproteobacteria bacterium]MBW2068971.1 response regulator [Deltaproteobacteria bacterium]